MHKTWTFQIITFGCKVNQYESQAIREAWIRAGAYECRKASEAEIIVVNSCAITAKGERDARQMLARLRRKAPQAKLLLTGCAARLLAQNTRLPADYDLILAPNDKALLLEPTTWLARLSHKELNALQDKPALYPPFQISRFKRARPVLKVQDGCTHRCTYCIVPTLRTHAASRSPAEVVDEAKRLIHQGYSELILSGINLKQYGKGTTYGDFWNLLRILDSELHAYSGRVRLRISSVEPSQLTARGLATLKDCHLLCPHLHISLQHASRKILRRMGRGHYKAQDLAQALTEIATFWPVFGLGCDIICGFPGEEEEDHVELLDFCTQMPFTYAHVFPYSPRPGTAAATFPERVSEKIQARRSLQLRNLFQKKNRAFREKLLAQNIPLKIVLEGEKGVCTKGVSEYYIACTLLQDYPQITEKRHALLEVKICALNEKGLTVTPICDEKPPKR